ncbi:MAG: selenide, water dikinase SelD [Ardenticatenales bacterium]|nr:selenide, water dikinase SelD [Ardenticatenales bacterium]
MAHVLQPLRDIFAAADHPDLLVGLGVADDAAVYKLNENQAIINTTDFFPPVVDDPYDYGAIAAANALSDVYAMGGEVLFAMNIVGFPDNLDRAILQEILRGGAEKVAEAGGVIVGGHSVSDQEPKYGLAVTGMIHPDKIKIKGGGQPGDQLLLTKPLGVGVVTTALKQGVADPAHVAAATVSMKKLNRAAANAAQAVAAHAMTDITGFGLLGHAYEMASKGNVAFRLNSEALPWLPGALDYGARGIFPGGNGRNQIHFHEHVTFDPGLDPLIQEMLWTPETSGGLLIAVAPERVAEFQAIFSDAVLIGEVTAGDGHIFVD